MRRIVLPLSGTALFGATLFVFFLSAGDYITPVFLGGIGSSGTFGTLIADQLSTTLNYPLGASIAFVMLALFAVLVVAAAVRRCARPGLLPEHTRMRRRPWVLTIVASLLLLFIYLPLLVVVLYGVQRRSRT